MEESWHKRALFSPKKRGWNKNGRLQKGCCIKVREDLFCVLMERARDNPTQLRKRKSKSGKKWNFWRARTGQYWVTLQSNPSDLWHQRHWCSSTANFFLSERDISAANLEKKQQIHHIHTAHKRCQELCKAEASPPMLDIAGCQGSATCYPNNRSTCKHNCCFSGTYNFT